MELTGFFYYLIYSMQMHLGHLEAPLRILLLFHTQDTHLYGLLALLKTTPHKNAVYSVARKLLQKLPFTQITIAAAVTVTM